MQYTWALSKVVCECVCACVCRKAKMSEEVPLHCLVGFAGGKKNPFS